MILRMIDKTSGNPALIAGTSPDSPVMIHSVQGWYHSDRNIETEALAFQDGDVIISKHRGSKEISMDFSAKIPSSSFSGAQAQTLIGIADEDREFALEVIFEEEDRGASAGWTESYDKVHILSVEAEALSSKEMSIQIKALVLDTNMIYSYS